MDGEKQRLAADLKQARELIEGTITPNDLVNSRAFVWMAGQYKSVEK